MQHMNTVIPRSKMVWYVDDGDGHNLDVADGVIEMYREEEASASKRSSV